jgi:hypothetical protein
MTPVREALEALLAFRHGDTKHLTADHARVLFEALSAAPGEPCAVKPLEWDAHGRADVYSVRADIEKRNAFYSSDEYRNMTTAEKCATQREGFLNDYD